MEGRSGQDGQQEERSDRTNDENYINKSYTTNLKERCFCIGDCIGKKSPVQNCSNMAPILS